MNEYLDKNVTMVCSHCGESLPLDSFYKSKTTLNWYVKKCKWCLSNRSRVLRTEKKKNNI